MGNIVLWNQKGGWEQMDGAQGLTRPSRFFDAQRAFQYNNYQVEQYANQIVDEFADSLLPLSKTTLQENLGSLPPRPSVTPSK